MRQNSISLGLRDGLSAEAIAKTCRDVTEEIDRAITNDFALWCAKTMRLCRASGDKTLLEFAQCFDPNADRVKAAEAMELLWHMYYGSEFREHLKGVYGEEKATVIYNHTSEHLCTHARRSALYANMFKLSAFADFKNFLARLDTTDFTRLVKLVDTVMNTPCLVECNPLHMPQLRSQVIADQASLKDRVISSILPDPNAGVKGLIEKTFSMIKDKLNPTGNKGVQTSDELCLEICASPCSILLMTVAACIAGSTGLILVMAPLFTAWSAVTAVSGIVKEHDDQADIHNFLKNTTTTLLTADYRPDLQQRHIESEQSSPAGPVHSSSLHLVVGSSGSIGRSGP